MIQNFETVKSELAELAEVINAFKSEAVQLRIIEMIFGGTHESSDDEPAGKPKAKPARKRTERKVRTKTSSGTRKKGKASGGTGAVATLSQLAEGAFFEEPRTINDIIEHCRHNLARSFKANEFSGKLGRMVRNKELTREKNADKQYEYKKP